MWKDKWVYKVQLKTSLSLSMNFERTEQTRKNYSGLNLSVLI